MSQRILNHVYIAITIRKIDMKESGLRTKFYYMTFTQGIRQVREQNLNGVSYKSNRCHDVYWFVSTYLEESSKRCREGMVYVTTYDVR